MVSPVALISARFAFTVEFKLVKVPSAALLTPAPIVVFSIFPPLISTLVIVEVLEVKFTKVPSPGVTLPIVPLKVPALICAVLRLAVPVEIRLVLDVKVVKTPSLGIDWPINVLLIAPPSIST